MPKFKDLTGQRYGKLTVIGRAENYGRGYAQFHVECDCGTEKVVRSFTLINGGTKTCGQKGCRKSGLDHGMYKHGHAFHHPLYDMWHNMVSRCKHPVGRNLPYKDVSVCDHWVNSFDAFAQHAYDTGYEIGLTIDRVDSRGDYEPFNVWFVPMIVNLQRTNKGAKHGIS